MCSRKITIDDAENASGMFTTIPIDKDIKRIPNVAGKLYFPKIQQEIAIDATNHNYLRSFWMAGFLHHEKNENENLVSAKLYLPF